MDRTEIIFTLFVFFDTWKYRRRRQRAKILGFPDSWRGGSGSVTVVWCAHNCDFIFLKSLLSACKKGFSFRRDLQILFDIYALNSNWALPQWVFLTVVPRFCLWCVFSGFMVIPRAPISTLLMYHHCLALKCCRWFADGCAFQHSPHQEYPQPTPYQRWLPNRFSMSATFLFSCFFSRKMFHRNTKKQGLAIHLFGQSWKNFFFVLFFMPRVKRQLKMVGRYR